MAKMRKSWREKRHDSKGLPRVIVIDGKSNERGQGFEC